MLQEYKLTVVGTMKRNKPELQRLGTDKNYANWAAPTSLFFFPTTIWQYEAKQQKTCTAGVKHGWCCNYQWRNQEAWYSSCVQFQPRRSLFITLDVSNYEPWTKNKKMTYVFLFQHDKCMHNKCIHELRPYSRGLKSDSRLYFMLSLYRELTVLASYTLLRFHLLF